MPIEEEPQSLFGNQEDDPSRASCEDPEKMNVPLCYDSDGQESDGSLSDIEGLDEGDAFYAEFVPFDFEAPISEIAKELREAKL